MTDDHRTTPTCAAACALGDAIDRRRFLQQGALAAAAAALAACGLDGVPTAPASVSATLQVADYPALAATGGVATLRANGSPIAVVRTGADTFVALSRICPHQGGTVARSTTGWKCPRHGATFTLAGAWTGGERTNALHAYPAVYDAASGTVTIG